MSVTERVGLFIKTVSVEDILLKSKTLKQANLYRIRKGGNCSTEILDELFKIYPNLNADWVLKGIGDMFVSDSILINDSNKIESIRVQQIGNGQNQVIQATSKDDLYERLTIEKDRHIKTLEQQINDLKKGKF